MKRYRIAILSVCATFASFPASRDAGAGVAFGQVDDFGSGTAGWQQGFISSTPPTVVSTGGPNGSGDAYLQNVSSGNFGAGGKQVMLNTAQWSGNYVSAGVTRITANLANFGVNPLNMRVWISGGTLGGQFSSTNGIPLPADAHWHSVTFDLSAPAMTAVSPSDSLSNVLSNVIQLRILSAGTPSEHGDMIASTLGADNLRATTVSGDANHDNTVNFSDLLTLAQHYGTSNAHWEDGDFNFDGAVNFTDLLALAQNYGSSVSLGSSPALAAAATVPEPALAIAAAGVLLTARRRRSPFVR
jgi:hypothetical protein